MSQVPREVQDKDVQVFLCHQEISRVISFIFKAAVGKGLETDCRDTPWQAVPGSVRLRAVQVSGVPKLKKKREKRADQASELQANTPALHHTARNRLTSVYTV